MEDVSDEVFRRQCRLLGAELCVTEFVQSVALLGGAERARRKVAFAPDDQPTAIQLHGSNAEHLARAAAVAERAAPAFIDINCGCWVQRVAGRGAGAGWLRNPAALVAMARQVVTSTSLAVTVKTRIGVGDETEMPIVDLARRLEDVGVAALTIHCRTARMGYGGQADWSFAARARAAVSMPVIVNGDIETADDAARALAETGCAAVMIGRRAIAHPWIFREARALLERGEHVPPPTAQERLALYRQVLGANVAHRGERYGVQVTRRHLRGWLGGLPGGEALRHTLLASATLSECCGILDAYASSLAQ